MTIDYFGIDLTTPITYTVIYSQNSTSINGVTDFDSLPAGVFYVYISNPPVTLQNTTVSGTFIQAGLLNGIPYYYRIRACDALNNCYTSFPAIFDTPQVPTVSFSFGPVKTIFDFSAENCDNTINNWDFPDVVSHAVRNPQNTNEIVLGSGNSPNNYFSFGPDFDNLTRSCIPVLTATNTMWPDPSDASSFNNQEWITSLYSDGTKIIGLVNNEFHDAAPGHPPCTAGNPYPGNPCWFNAITYATSLNGHTFTQTNTAADLVSAAPAQWNYSTMNTHPYGHFGPSNIIQHTDGYYYTLFGSFTVPGNQSQSWTCIMRTNDLDDPASWRAYNAATQTFDLTMFSPYLVPGQLPCSQVADGLQGSLTQNTYLASFGLGPYMLVGAGVYLNPANNNNLECGFWYSLSSDLINWTSPALIKNVILPFFCGTFGPGVDVYPSIIDHASSDQINFTTAGQTPHLYYTHFVDNLDRDLVRQQLTITVTP